MSEPKYRCDKKLDEGARQCNAPATSFYQSEVARDVSARCEAHGVVPYKAELGRLLVLTEEEYEREIGAAECPPPSLRRASGRVGSVYRCPGLSTNIEQPDGSLLPITFDLSASIDLHVSASSAGIELRALPCTLSVQQASRLRDLLALAIVRADGLPDEPELVAAIQRRLNR